jgi:hypothetical protein
MTDEQPMELPAPIKATGTEEVEFQKAYSTTLRIMASSQTSLSGSSPRFYKRTQASSPGQKRVILY